MREIERISTMLETIEKAWKLYPDLRLGQLLMNCAKSKDIFYLEDEELLMCLQEYIESNK